MIEDGSAPHQIRLLHLPDGRLAVSCTCLKRKYGAGSGRGSPRGIIEARKIFPAADANAAWQQFHDEQAAGGQEDEGSHDDPVD